MTGPDAQPGARPGSLAVVGAGPGVGAAVARRFGREGLPAGLVARNRMRLDALVRDLVADGVPAAGAVADARRPEELRHALRELDAALGPPEVLCVSPLPDIDLIKPVLQTPPQELLASLELGVGAAATAALHVLPAMRERGRGTLLFTSGSGALTPSADRAASAVTTTALTTYVRLLHQALAPEQIHVTQLVVVGPIGPGLHHEPDTVAELLWQCHAQRDQPQVVLR